MEVSGLVWLVTISIIVGLILVDLLTVSSKPHDVMFKEASFWSIFYISIAVSFGIWVFSNYGTQFGTEYFTAYLVEKSLSVDNIFVFGIILAQFAVRSIYHQRVLLRQMMNHPKNYRGILHLSRPVEELPYYFGFLSEGFAGYGGLRFPEDELARRGLLLLPPGCSAGR